MAKFLVIAAAIALIAVPAQAQQMQLDIKNGRVNLDATAVPVRQILAEWGRIGGTRIVGAEKILGSVTLKLVDMPERQALDLILRNVAGYMAAPRVATSEGQSAYGRIVVLPTSTPPANAAVNTPVAGINRGGPPRPPEMEKAPEPVQPPDVADTGMNQPVFTFPQQQPGQIFNPIPNQPGPFGMPMPAGTPGAQPVISLQPNANGQPTIYNFMPTNGAPQQGGFQVVGSPTPGMIQQPAQQPGVIKPPPK